MRFFSGERVRMSSETYEVPVGSLGTVREQDYGDTDFRTYTVAFDNGVVLYEVREYHLIAI